MVFDESFFEFLLYQEESVVFDVKSEQYKFIKATNDEKSELLKDILCFCNAWRQTDSYIFVGAKEVKGGANIVTGVDHFLDDANIQQFVNGKTQKPVEFSFVNKTFFGKMVSIIHIPLQERPIYLKKDFGKLKSNVVYIRRGSSCGEATLDEISKMGNMWHLQRERPTISISIASNVKSPDNILRVNPYKVIDKKEAKTVFEKMRLSDNDVDIVLKHKDKLNSIEDIYPDGVTFFPYKVSQVLEFREKINNSLRLISDDFLRLGL